MPKRFLSGSGGAGLLCIGALLNLSACLWTPEQKRPEMVGVQAAATKTTSLLRPGQTVTGLDGVQVAAPPLWRGENTSEVKVTVERVDRAALACPIHPAFRLASPVYAVSVGRDVAGGGGERFRVRLPVRGFDPAYLAPLRLSPATFESVGPATEQNQTAWGGDLSDVMTAEYVEFETSGFWKNEPYQPEFARQFTIALLDEPRPNASPQTK